MAAFTVAPVSMPRFNMIIINMPNLELGIAIILFCALFLRGIWHSKPKTSLVSSHDSFMRETAYPCNISVCISLYQYLSNAY